MPTAAAIPNQINPMVGHVDILIACTVVTTPRRKTTISPPARKAANAVGIPRRRRKRALTLLSLVSVPR